MKNYRRKNFNAIARYYGVVQDGTIFAQHLFKGLNRPLMLNDDMNADKTVFIYSWRSEIDYIWNGSPQNGYPKERIPPKGSVFVVLIREEEDNEYGVKGSIEKWNLVRENPKLQGAPVESDQRYAKKLWSKKC